MKDVNSVEKLASLRVVMWAVLRVHLTVDLLDLKRAVRKVDL